LARLSSQTHPLKLALTRIVLAPRRLRPHSLRCQDESQDIHRAYLPVPSLGSVVRTDSSSGSAGCAHRRCARNHPAALLGPPPSRAPQTYAPRLLRVGSLVFYVGMVRVLCHCAAYPDQTSACAIGRAEGDIGIRFVSCGKCSLGSWSVNLADGAFASRQCL
jgi:hypothetical protein